MPDFRVDDLQHAKDESRRAGLAAMGMWTVAGSYSMNPAVLSDGWIPDYWVASWPQGRRHAKALVDAGMWMPSERDGQPGWQFTNWGGQQPAAKVLADREAARKRMQDLRHGKRSGDVRANVRPNISRTQGERSGEVRRLPQPHPGGSVEGGVSRRETPARAEMSDPPKFPAARPIDRCPNHAGEPGDPGPCRACGDARRAAQEWDLAKASALALERSAAARQRAEDRARAIVNCALCDPDGYVGRVLCDHDPTTPERAARGLAAARAAISGRTPSDPP